MLVILTEQQVLSTKQICSGCLMADSGGLPRWRQGKLCCGQLIENQKNNLGEDDSRCEQYPALEGQGLRSLRQKANIYQCQMGFHLTNIKSDNK